MFLYVSLTWVRLRFMFLYVSFMFLYVSFMFLYVSLCFFMFLYGFSWVWDGQSLQIYVSLCFFYVSLCFFMFLYVSFLCQGPDLGQGGTLTQPMKPQGIYQKLVLKLVFKSIASNIDKPCHWPGPAHLAWPSLQASRPPSLQASRTPGLQAYKPPGLQLKMF